MIIVPAVFTSFYHTYEKNCLSSSSPIISIAFSAFSLEEKYIATILPEHPRSYQDGVVFLHVLIAEQLLGRGLSKDEVVHHVDHNKHNNIFSNFYVFDSKGSHACFHYAKKPCLSIVGDVLNCFAFHNDKDLHEWVVENS